MDTSISCFTIAFYVITTQAQSPFLSNSRFPLVNDLFGQVCAPLLECNAYSKYRSTDGSCNNLATPWWGSYNTPHLRHVYPYFNDGIYEIREQSDGRPLPNVRTLQLELFLFRQLPYWNYHNVLFMEWGQFIAHDTSKLPPDTSATDNCCTAQNQSPVPRQCGAVIDVPPNDPVYSKLGEKCINFIRALTSANVSCPLIPTTFVVQATHFIDASQVYGSYNSIASSLRAFVGGRLKSDFASNRQEFCPQRNRTTFKCDTSPFSLVCFAAGDDRVNQNLGIALFQTIFLRFHNVVASQLQNINLHWDDELLYQETRRIVIGVIQHITYTQYLPILLGEQYLAQRGFFGPTVYDETINPSTAQEYATGAFRVLHSEIPEAFNLIGCGQFSDHHVFLTDWMNRPDLLPQSDNFDRMIRGLMETPTRLDQSSYNPLISNRLFQSMRSPFSGQDLLCADIQRGRDVGMPPYNKLRTISGLPEAKSFMDLLDVMSYEDVQKLKELYVSVNDIDSMVGMLLEIPAEGAKMGPTARSIIADSFYRYKIGDRFFYDLQGQPGSFRPKQLKTIKTMTLGHVICAISNMKYVPYDIFSPFVRRYFDGAQRGFYCEGIFENKWEAWREAFY